MATLDYAQIAEKILALTPQDGTSVGNKTLREQLTAQLGFVVTEEAYYVAREPLIAAGLLAKGQGRGGAVRRTLQAPNALGVIRTEDDPELDTSRQIYMSRIDLAPKSDNSPACMATVIDNALASGDSSVMRNALETLRCMVERSSIEVDTAPADEQEQIEPVPHLISAKRPRGRPRKDQTTVRSHISSVAREFSCFTEYSKFAWEGLSDSERKVVHGRWGFEGRRQTLEELAALCDPQVTREWIRQIEVSAVRKIASWKETESMLNRLKALEHQCAMPIPKSDLAKLDSWFDAVSVESVWFPNFLRALSAKTLDFVQVGDVAFLLPFAKSDWTAITTGAKRRLHDLANAGIPLSEVDDQLARLLPEGAAKFASLLRIAAGGPHLQLAKDANGTACLVAMGQGVDELIKATLFEADHPLHWSDVVRRVQSRAGRTTNVMTIRNATAASALLLGRGTYGLRRHIPLTDDEISQLVAAAEEVVLSEPSRQWTTVELCREIVAQGLFVTEDVDKYMLGACLRLRTNQLNDVGRGSWRAEGNGGTSDRILIRERVVALLESAGRPLSNEELKKRLSSERGLDETFQIQPRDPLFRIGKAMWGLLDRDLAISMTEAAAYVSELRAELLRTGKGIHVSEVLQVLARGGLPTDWIDDPELMLTLARRSQTLRVTPSRYLVLPDWSDERRVLPRHAILEAARANPSRNSSEIASLASKQLGRAITARMVLSVLNNHDFRFDSNRGWVVDEAEAEMTSE